MNNINCNKFVSYFYYDKSKPITMFNGKIPSNIVYEGIQADKNNIYKFISYNKF
jgi:hypothetical protein